MSTLTEIKTDLDHARKQKNQTLLTLLVTLYSEAVMVGKTKRNGDPTEEEVISVVKKFKLGVEEIAKIKGINEELQNEIDLYNHYLPVMLTKDELTKIISDIRPRDNLGQIMKYLKDNYAGIYDGKDASEIAKTLL